MVMLISVGKNVARIADREFPIDTDLTLLKSHSDGCRWSIRSAEKTIGFKPVIDNEVTPEAFRTYNQAFHQSIAFNEKGQLRKLFSKKEKGPKVIPGHGVFVLPSKMQVIRKGSCDIQIRVFDHTELAQNFHYSNYESMVAAAAEYYFSHIRSLSDPINESLWYPVKYQERVEREFHGMPIPSGVLVRQRASGHYVVEYCSTKAGRTKYYGTAKTLDHLFILLLAADDQRHKEQMVEAMYRFVSPRYITLSQYMKSL